MLDRLFLGFDRILVLDTETTGISCKSDEIIELGAFRVRRGADGALVPDGEMNCLIKLSPGRTLPEKITEITGITPGELAEKGVEKSAAAEELLKLLDSPRLLLAAYNAQFDLCFLYYFLNRLGLAGHLRGVRFLDALTVYKDRRPYPHKLCNAIESYALQEENSHRAVDDAKAALSLLTAMEAEKDDLDRYLNCFGYNPKYGISGPKISSVTYLPQDYRRTRPLYEDLP